MENCCSPDYRWLLVISLMLSFCAVSFSMDALDEIWALIESVSQDFHTYFCSGGYQAVACDAFISLFVCKKKQLILLLAIPRPLFYFGSLVIFSCGV